MAVNYGKKFEAVIRSCLERIDDVSLDRIPDQTNFYKGSQNICDFIVYKQPYEYYFECKSIHGNTFPLVNLTDTQYFGLLEKHKKPGVFAGVIVWWIDRDVTRFIPVHVIKNLRQADRKSIRFDDEEYEYVNIPGKKKRIFFDYDMEVTLNAISDRQQSKG